MWVKHATYQKAESLRANSLSNLDSTVNNNSIFNKKSAEFSMKWQVLLHFYMSTCAYNHLQPPLQFPPKMRFSTSVNFELVILFLLVQKFMLTIPLAFLSSIAQQCFTSFILRTTIPKIYTKNVFSAPAIWPIQAVSGVQWAREFYDIWNYLISSFVLKVWSVITGGSQSLIPYSSG